MVTKPVSSSFMDFILNWKFYLILTLNINVYVILFIFKKLFQLRIKIEILNWNSSFSYGNHIVFYYIVPKINYYGNFEIRILGIFIQLDPSSINGYSLLDIISQPFLNKNSYTLDTNYEQFFFFNRINIINILMFQKRLSKHNRTMIIAD